MSVEQVDVVDFISIDKATGDLWLSISDHLPWAEDEGKHLILLQDKLNTYLRFVEGGELLEAVPTARQRGIVINLVCQFAPSSEAEAFLELAARAIRDAGFHLRFEVKSK